MHRRIRCPLTKTRKERKSGKPGLKIFLLLGHRGIPRSLDAAFQQRAEQRSLLKWKPSGSTGIVFGAHPRKLHPGIPVRLRGNWSCVRAPCGGSSWEARREGAAWGWRLLERVCAGAGGAARAALLSSCKNNQPAHCGCCYWRGRKNGMHPFRRLKASAISVIHLTVLADMINFQRIGHGCVRFCKYQELARFCKYWKSFSRNILFSSWLAKGCINYTFIALINRLLTDILIEQQYFTRTFNL